MTPENFCYWLQGYFELRGFKPDRPIPGDASALISKHLDMVFFHAIDPKAGGPEVQKQLNEIHSGGNSPIHNRPRC